MTLLSDKLKRRIVIAATSEQYGKELIDAIENASGTPGPQGPQGDSGVAIATAPLTYDGQTKTVAITQASALADGFLSSADWSTFSGKQPSIGTGTTSQYLRGDLTWQTVSLSSFRVLTVGQDAATIAGCIALCTSPTITNSYIVRIPPGVYTESLTIPGSVHLQGMTNSMENTSTTVTGQHTIYGTNVNTLNNRVTISNLLFTSTHATTPMFTISGTTAQEVNINGCYLQNINAATTAQLLNVGANATLYIGNSRTAMGLSGAGGTHITITGGNVYTYSYYTANAGTRFLEISTAGYAQLINAQVTVNGTDLMRVAANGLVVCGYSIFNNEAAIGNGCNLLGAGATLTAFGCTFNIQNNAASYVVTGVSGTAYFQTANNYTNAPGVVTRNVKIKNTVSLLAYTAALTPSA